MSATQASFTAESVGTHVFGQALQTAQLGMYKCGGQLNKIIQQLAGYSEFVAGSTVANEQETAQQAKALERLAVLSRATTELAELFKGNRQLLGVMATANSPEVEPQTGPNVESVTIPGGVL